MFGSSSPFGASTPSPFGAAATSNPFGATTNPFGTTNQANNPFAAKPFGSTATPFGGQTGSSLFGGGASTGVFGATQTPTFGASTSAFGGSTSTPAFGAFGQKPASPFSSFGSTTPAHNPFGSPSFGQSQPAFGSQPLGSTTPSFGAQSAPAFGSTNSPLFGSSPSFGSSSTPAFGSTTTPAFGASAPAFGSTPTFGQSAPAFGASPTPAFATNTFGSFGGTTFGGQQRVGSRVSPYAVTNDTDAGVGGQPGKFLCISAMPAYKNKSQEELRWEDYQAGDKGGPNPASPQQPATAGIFGQSQQTTASSSPFGTATTGFGQAATPNPFAASSTPNLFGGAKPTFGSPSAPAPTFGASSTPAFGSTPFGSSTPAFGAASTTPAFGSTPSPFGQSSASAFGGSTFGSTTPSLFGQTTPLFGASSPAFGAASSSPAFGSQNSSPFGGSSIFGSTQTSAAGGLFSTPASQPFGTTAAFGQSQPAFGSNLFSNTTTPGSIFGQTKPAGLTQSTPSLSFGGFGSTPTQTPNAFQFPSFQPTQQGGNIFNTSSGLNFGQTNTLGQQPTQSVTAVPTPVTNPFGTLPAMPQMMIGRSSGSGPSVQYGIASMPVSDKPPEVRVNSLLTPRSISQRSKIRMHARRYHPKKDSPKVSFFSDGDDVPSTPKADVMFVPRENPRALFIRQTDQSPVTPSAAKRTPDIREMSTPVEANGFEEEERAIVINDSRPLPIPESPQASWGSPDNITEAVANETISTPLTKSPEKPPAKQLPKVNGFREEHNHRGNGFISITGHRAGEAAIAYEHGADIEALMPKLRHADYFTEPKVQELAAMERAEPGHCRRVADFVVGRKGYGQVKFLGETDVRRLDLESIIQFNKCEVLVYMDENKKPAVGQGLNKPAEVTLLNVRCVDKKTGQHHSDGPEVEKFEKRLKKKTEEQGAEFISYDGSKGEWKFRVKHFSRYGMDFGYDEGDLIANQELTLLWADVIVVEATEQDGQEHTQ